ncbi:ECF RNA polymerase sigma factor RpoE [Pseudoruegeria aquimaris]|uniref:ECF RNA polymerase sigma factor RpoE n=2 Tax=Pseudoruegeria aquimaris TaxID=393663 RepID=A0A1Y5TRY0_9RHOB|nr:ECF RNA polymerase sigma factor RpoE [Pseudoruegeria aquimaris]
MVALSEDLKTPKPALSRAARRASDSNAGGTTLTDRSAEDREYTEQTLWMLAVRDKRDKAAFGCLFDFYAPRLKAMILRNGISGSHAEDIVQDVLLTVWNKAGQFDPQRAGVSGWIYQIARNRQIDLARKYNRPVPEELRTEDRTEEEAGQILALEQETQKLKRALAALPEEQREMVEKAYLGELTHSDIRNMTGLPLGTIKSRIRLGLDRLRNELKDLR